MIRTLFAAAALSMAFAAPAFARDRDFTATLQNPVPERTRIVSERAVWTCVGESCTATARQAATVRTCREFVREAGAVVAYGADGEALSAEDLAQCNASARQARTAGAQLARN